MAKVVHKFKEPTGNSGLSFGHPDQIYLCGIGEWHHVGIEDSVDISGEDGVVDLQVVDDADELELVKAATIVNWGVNEDSLDDKLTAAGL